MSTERWKPTPWWVRLFGRPKYYRHNETIHNTDPSQNFDWSNDSAVMADE